VIKTLLPRTKFYRERSTDPSTIYLSETVMTSKATVNSLAELEQTQDFIRRHIGPSESETQAM